METSRYMKMQQHCNALCSNGKELSITWEGGGDQGAFQMLIDGTELDELKEIEEGILTHVEDHIGYGSFAGEFSTDGKLIYNALSGRFEGTDNYSDSEGDFKDCQLAIRVPAEVWFDSFNFLVSHDMSGLLPEISITLRINHGPYPDFFEDIEKTLKTEIATLFANEIADIEDFESMELEHRVMRSEFVLEDGWLVYLVSRIHFYRFNMDVKDISIGFDGPFGEPLTVGYPLFPNAPTSI